MEAMEYFFDIFGGVAGDGPGSCESTRRAYESISGLAKYPRILDIGCYPDEQVVDLLKISGAEVLALNCLPLMIGRSSLLAVQGVSQDIAVIAKAQHAVTPDFPPRDQRLILLFRQE